MLSIIITIIFLIINFALYIINDNYLDNKIKKENDQFLQITRHIINENEIEVALEYVIHYTHIHEVEIEIMDENQNMLFSSEVSHRYSNQYQLVTLKGTFTVFIDNTDSITVNSVRLNSLYINISLVIIYVFSLVILIRNDKINSNQLDHDLKTVLKLIDNNNENTEHSFIQKILLFPFKVLLYPIAFVLITIYEGLKWVLQLLRKAIKRLIILIDELLEWLYRLIILIISKLKIIFKQSFVKEKQQEQKEHKKKLKKLSQK